MTKSSGRGQDLKAFRCSNFGVVKLLRLKFLWLSNQFELSSEQQVGVEMESISSLNKFTWAFQLFGLQNFPLSIVSKSKIPKYPSKFYKCIVIFWLLWSLTFIGLFFKTFVNAHFENKEDLNRVINILEFITNYSSVSIATGYSFFNHRKIVGFFKKGQEILNLCSLELGCKENFGKFKRNFIVMNLICDFAFAVAIADAIRTHVDSYDSAQFWALLVITIYFQFILKKFNFYVHVINFFLGILPKLIKQNFGGSQDEKSISVLKVSALHGSERRKVLVLRKVYFLITEMAEVINHTMGLVIFTQMIMTVVSMIGFGFEFYSKHSTVSHIYSKLNSLI
jgi:hypothetical protein